VKIIFALQIKNSYICITVNHLFIKERLKIMSMKRLTRQQFQERFEDALAIIEADYQVVHFRYFINRSYGLGIAVTYRFNTAEVEREYYAFAVSEEIILKLTSAYVYITNTETRKRVMNSEMIAIFNAEIQEDLQPYEILSFNATERSEDEDGSIV
jgi:hypothetical protein